MEEIISKEIVRNLLGIRGEVRGVALKNHEEFILKEKGQAGLAQFEQAVIETAGQPLDHQRLQTMKFYPLGFEALELLVIQKLFDFKDEDFERLGEYGSKVSLVMKAFLKYFGSIDALARQAPVIWKKYYTVGDLKVGELAKDKKYIILVLENFQLHPLHCLHLKGYFGNVVKMVVGTRVSCQEIKCVHRGDDCHEFLLKW